MMMHFHRGFWHSINVIHTYTHYIHTYMHTYISTYIRTSIHTYIHTHKYIDMKMRGYISVCSVAKRTHFLHSLYRNIMYTKP